MSPVLLTLVFSPHIPFVLLFFFFALALAGAHWARRE